MPDRTEMLRAQLRRAALRAVGNAERAEGAKLPPEHREAILAHTAERIRQRWLEDARADVAALEALAPAEGPGPEVGDVR